MEIKSKEHPRNFHDGRELPGVVAGVRLAQSFEGDGERIWTKSRMNFISLSTCTRRYMRAAVISAWHVFATASFRGFSLPLRFLYRLIWYAIVNRSHSCLNKNVQPPKPARSFSLFCPSFSFLLLPLSPLLSFLSLLSPFLYLQLSSLSHFSRVFPSLSYQPTLSLALYLFSSYLCLFLLFYFLLITVVSLSLKVNYYIRT